ncbi:MAG: hypothetical protein KBD36_02705 [Alphaproteobacteria bacterium]|nr:hypothetical protein [Alphaproteobacteria bacterium]MBP9776738.1 hypothetical protein [Alphaproteobacteria bacterium]
MKKFNKKFCFLKRLSKPLFVSFLVFFFLILTSSFCFSAPSPKVWNLPDSNPIFVGREKQLQMIHSFFAKREGHLLALTGGPGFGKTQIAKKYAQEFSNHYDLIWWFDAQQDLPSQYERLAIALNQILSKKEKIIPSQFSKEVLIDSVKNILRIKNIKYLLIFDNPQTYTQVRNFIPCTHDQPGRHILLTSRNANIWINKVEIGKFERQESLQFLQKTLPNEIKEDKVKLAGALSDYPLGLTIAAGFIKSHLTTTIDKYLLMHLKRTLKKGESSPSTLLDQYPRSALAALEISQKFIEEESKDSLQTLLFMSLLNSKDIPESYIELWLKNTSSSLTADEAIKHVYDQSLIEVNKTAASNSHQKLKKKERIHYLSIHDSIHQLINEGIPMKEKKELIAKATEVMLEVFSGSAEDMTKKITKEPIHLQHAQKLCANAREVNYTSDGLLQLKICILQSIMTVFRDFDAVEPLLIEIDEDIEAGLSLAPYYEALLKVNKGFLAHNQAQHELAIQFMNEAMLILAPYEQYKEEKLRAITNLIQYHAMRGEWEKTEELIESGNKLCKDLPCESCICFFIYAWAFTLNDQGKFQQALDVLNKADAYPMLSVEYPPIYQGVSLQKIEAFIKLEKLDEARPSLRELEKKLNEFYAKKTPVLAYMLILKGMILLRDSDKRPKAFETIKEALEICNKSFKGPIRHRAQGKAYLALGKAFAAQGDFQNALEAYRMSDRIYTAVLKNKKIDDVSDLYKDLVILGAKMKDEAIVHEYLKAHIQTFGHIHSRTKEILLFLNQNGLTVPL